MKKNANRVIVDEGAAPVNYRAIEIESKKYDCLSKNLLEILKLNGNPLLQTQKKPETAVILLTSAHCYATLRNTPNRQ